ncbi:Gfo/Idh/MocA family oxidoreductase [Flavobacteriaceae bacterium TP-CH-4]|uniref:Gfo/Idh/MocA family oxidoreductase n=1 Tax=Pelagihabitans pacificus TaxID=2696054 RepID=A0A967AUG9_9FLAO|nr:Gfo/Idh/MocA family oxidoreductase [Pelagihabitans pacificus]NHF57822.1 Gfo/Idh/MocA family oxidoreductase [Pelagihabitans pacificus]
MKRREFVVKGSLATAALGTSSVALGKVFDKSPNETLRIGIIGTGDRGGGLIPLINQIENFEVTACCDILPFRLNKALNKVDGKKATGYKEYRKLLEQPDLDAVLVATPFNTHSKIAVDALDAGKHVYCEKTLAKGFMGIEQLVAKAQASNKIFQTGHQYHSSRLYTHVVDLIKNGKVGTISAFECQWNRNGDWRRPVPEPGLERLINWRMYREFSGGLVAELCSHQIDFVNWVTDSVPEKVIGVGGIDYWKDGRETYDNIHLIYTYPKGIKAKFTCLTSNAMNDYRIKVLGDKGSIILDYTKAWFYPEGSYQKEMGEVDGVAGATVAWDKGKGIPIEVDHADPSKQALMDFKESIANTTEPISNVISGAKAAICVQMGLDAMHEEKIVEWKGHHGLEG